MQLKTLGHPALHQGETTLASMRRKDLALLVYLCVEGAPVHARSRLATLLWGESPEERARHSLTQALGRLVRTLPPGVLAPEKDAVRWGGGLACDAVDLVRGGLGPDAVDDAFSLYAGHFLEGFDLGAGAEDFRDWTDRRRADVRNAALHLLERAGEAAELTGEWERALRLGERAVEIDPVWEQGHRRIMRAQAARGERNRALRHYQEFEAWLDREVAGEPDPDTRALAEQLRAPDPPEPRPAPAPPSSAGGAADRGADAHGSDDDGLPVPSTLPAAADGSAPLDDGSAPDGEDPHPPGPADGEPGPAEPWERPPLRVPMAIWLALLAVGLLLALFIAVAENQRRSDVATEAPPAHGESVRLRGSDRVYLAFAETLYEYPDSATLCVCTGWYPEVVREMSALPAWPRRRLPSVMDHGWIGGTLPIVSDHPGDLQAYAAVGCIHPGIRDPETLDSIFGSGAPGRMLQVPDSVLRRLPRTLVAHGHPLRPAGTLIRAPDGRIRWITYHGGALAVDDPHLLATYCRSPDEALAVDSREFGYYRPWGTLDRGPDRCPRQTRAPPPAVGAEGGADFAWMDLWGPGGPWPWISPPRPRARRIRGAARGCAR